MILGEYCIDKHGNSCVQTPLLVISSGLCVKRLVQVVSTLQVV